MSGETAVQTCAWRRLTASGLERAERCPASFALPAVESRETDAMRAGTGRHAFLDAVTGSLPSDAAREIALDMIPRDAPWRAQCEAIDLAELLAVTGADTGRIEVALSHAWSPRDDAAQALDVVTHRSYPDAAGIPGTLDWLVTDSAGRVRVVDFKGSQPTTPARSNLQLALYALSVARVRGLDNVAVQLVYLGEDGSVTADTGMLDAWDLDAAAERIRRVWERVMVARDAVTRGQMPEMRSGEHCGDCPCMSVCPAMAQLARELATTAPDAAAIVSLSDAEAGAAWERIALLEDILSRAKESLRTRALRRMLPLSDGRHLVAVESTRRTVDARKALPVLREAFGARADDEVEHSIASSVVDALATEAAKASGATARAAKARIWDALREAGAVREATYVRLRPRRLSGGGDAA